MVLGMIYETAKVSASVSLWLYVIVFALRDVLGLAGQSDQYVVDNVDLVHKQP